MEQFIREKIKDKPLNKKDLQKQAQQHSAEWHLQWLQALFLLYFCRLSTDNQKSFRWKNNNYVQTATQQSGIDDSSDAYSENGTQSTESGTSSEPSSQTYQPTLADYQAVQNQLYRVGALATKFVVGVTGVTDATDIFNNS